MTVTSRLRRQVAGSRVIAADGGMVHAAPLLLEPELWVGDFDSSDAVLYENYRHINRQSHPPAKDLTDGELAVEEALKRGADTIQLIGGLGGRSDHAFHHMAFAVSLAMRGLNVMATSGHEEAYPLIPGSGELALPPQSQFSVIAFSDLTALTLENVAWPLKDKDVVFGSSLTVSNVALGTVSITLKEGKAIVLAALDCEGL